MSSTPDVDIRQIFTKEEITPEHDSEREQFVSELALD